MKFYERPMRVVQKITNFHEPPRKWWKITNQAGGPVMVNFFGEIGMFGITAGDFVSELAGYDGDIEMHINCPGGDVFEAITIFNTLGQRRGTVSVIVDGVAASAGSFIAQAASPGMLAMAPHSKMMIHLPFGMAAGSADDMRKTADLLDEIKGDIAAIYANRSGKPASYWMDKMAQETWLSDRQAVAEGLADKILGQEAPENQWDLGVYNAGTNGYHNGHPRVDPDGDGDCDACPEGDTDNDYWDEDGNQIQPLPGEDDWQQSSNRSYARFLNAKYNTDDRKRMAKSGQAMDDGSYPVADAEDLDNAIHAVGRGGADHDAIRRHIIKRAKALGLSERIPDNWNSDGSMKDAGATDQADDKVWAELSDLFRLVAGKE